MSTSANRSSGNQRFVGRHHARFIDGSVPFHVVSRVFQGRHLLRPSRELNSIVVGVFGRALELYSQVQLYALAVMSNHIHIMLQGPPHQVPAFVGFIKREISRRWGHRPDVGWHGTMWHEYNARGLPTAESQEHCLKYILSQGVKEGLVKRPEEWPGVHCAHALVTGAPLKGRWLNATAYSRATDAESRKRRPQPISRDGYATEYDVGFAPIPAWRYLDAETRQRRVQCLVDEIVEEGTATRNGRPALGACRVRRIPLERRTEVPRPPWLTRRRRVICWAAEHEAETRRFIDAYNDFQRSFRLSAIEDRLREPAFPSGSFAPGKWTPVGEPA